MLRSIQQFHIFSILFLLGCAAVGPPSGGSADKKGPELVSILPNNVLTLALDQKITFIFDELIDPVSVPPSIQIGSNIKYKLNIRGREIVIRPDKNWPDNSLVHFNLSRKIRDYQKNMMAKAVNKIFSTGSIIPDGVINGQVIKYDPKKLVELGLYKWPLSDSSQYIQKIEADEQGNFQFRGVKDGQYTIGAIQGSLWDMKQQIKKKKYAILTADFISISADENEKEVKMILSKPVERQKITSVEMLSQHAFHIIMDNNDKEYFMIDSTYKSGDSISINLEKTNQLETYMLPKFSFILPEITDTISPQLNNSQFIEGLFTLEFSEPINMETYAITTNRDTMNIPISFEQTNGNTIICPNLSDTIYNIELWGESIHDWEGNIFSDSMKTVSIIRPKKTEEEKIIGGNILGLVEYDGKEPLIIEAHNIKSNSYYLTDVKNKKFSFSNLPAGLYTLWGFEVFNAQNPDIYFSGLWEPFHRAAWFSTKSDTIDVRARWDIEGIIIDFK